jgi:pilus assembly protein Flp/PilA
MTKFGAFFARVRKDESGATMIEYSILIGIITVGAIVGISFMGGYVSTQWATLMNTPGIATPPAPAPAGPPAGP